MKTLWQGALLLGVLGVFSLGVMLACAKHFCLDSGRIEQAAGQQATRTMGGNTHCPRQTPSRHVPEAGVPTLAPPREVPKPAASHQCADQPGAQVVYVHVETDQPGLEIELIDD
jgi:hypothetical protein